MPGPVSCNAMTTFIYVSRIVNAPRYLGAVPRFLQGNDHIHASLQLIRKAYNVNDLRQDFALTFN